MAVLYENNVPVAVQVIIYILMLKIWIFWLCLI